MQNFLDMRTLIFVSGVTSFILFVCMLYIRRKQKTYEGFLYWVLAALTNSAGLFLLSQRGILADFATIVVGNTLIIISIVLINIGLSRFAGTKPYFKFYLTSIFLFVMFYLYFTYANTALIYRFIVFSSFQALLCIVMVIIVRRDLPLVLQKRNYFLYWFLILCVAWPLFILIASFFQSDTVTDLMKAGFFHKTVFLGDIAAYIVLVVGLMIINMQRVEQEMLAAQDEVKTITGLIPICAICKKIRDDKGSWNQLEAYLNEHADMKFTHGICPECMQKMREEKAPSK